MIKRFFTSVSTSVSRKDLIVVASWTIGGSILQVACRKYCQKKETLSENLERKAEAANSKSGQILKITVVKVIFILKPVIIFMAKKGGLTALLTSSVWVFGPKIIASKVLINYIYKSLPYSHLDNEMKRSIVVDVAKDNRIDDKWKYFFEFMENFEIGYDQKLEKAYEFLKKSKRRDKIVFLIMIYLTWTYFFRLP